MTGTREKTKYRKGLASVAGVGKGIAVYDKEWDTGSWATYVFCPITALVSCILPLDFITCSDLKEGEPLNIDR